MQIAFYTNSSKGKKFFKQYLTHTTIEDLFYENLAVNDFTRC